MERWLILAATIVIVCAIYPPVLGIFLGMGAYAAIYYVIYKALGG